MKPGANKLASGFRRSGRSTLADQVSAGSAIDSNWGIEVTVVFEWLACKENEKSESVLTDESWHAQQLQSMK